MQNFDMRRDERYKTALCQAYKHNGLCIYAGRCHFAHGLGELRSRRTVTRPILRQIQPPAPIPKRYDPLDYRTELCKGWINAQKFCGVACVFAHGPDELRTREFNELSGLGTLSFGDVLSFIKRENHRNNSIPRRHPRYTGSYSSRGERPRAFSPDFLLPFYRVELPMSLQIFIDQTTKENVVNPTSGTRKAFLRLCSQLVSDTRLPQAGGGHSTITLNDPSCTQDHAAKILHALAMIERAQIAYDMHAYDIDERRMPSFGYEQGMWKIDNLEGLAEKRPSVLRGDEIQFFRHGESDSVCHVGYAHFVNVDNVVVSLAYGRLWADQLVDIRFVIKVIDYYLLHRAIAHCGELKLFVTPAFSLKVPPAHPTDVDLDALRRGRGSGFLEKLNEEQFEFVEGTVNNKSTTLRILWGPPGTGKTTTCVATALALLVKRDARILFAAPSNAAADNIVQMMGKHLKAVGKERNRKPTVGRLSSLSRDPKTVPSDVAPFSIRLKRGAIHACDVVVSTLGTCARTFGVCGIPSLSTYHFTHIIVDEAGQVDEGTLCLPQSFFLPGVTQQLILAGDPRQLGPVIHSPICRQHGMQVSPLERLVSNEEIVKECCKVIHTNYRSHPDILDLVNIFYPPPPLHPPSDHRESQFRDDSASGLILPSLLPSAKGARVTFHHVMGKEEREPDSPSVLNRDECNVVLRYITALLRAGVDHDDIVVLAPYRKQVEKIRGKIYGEIAKPRGYTDSKKDPYVLVTTVEMFQGKEARYIILTCVRSTSDDLTLEADVKRHLGFIQQPNRLNVAISRAIDALVIVGNFKLMSRDKMWARILSYPKAHRVKFSQRDADSGAANPFAFSEAEGESGGNAAADDQLRGVERLE